MYGLISPTFLCVKGGAVNWPLKQMFKGHVLMEARATEISNCIHGHDKYLQILLLSCVWEQAFGTGIFIRCKYIFFVFVF